MEKTAPAGSRAFWSGKKVLVTGGGGFLGSHLCRRIRDAHGEVYATSRTKRDGAPGLNWLSADFADLATAQGVLADIRPNVIVHLAGSVGASPDLELVLPTYHSLLTSTVNILLAATQAGCDRILLTSSCTEPTAQTHPVPKSPYAAAKWASSAYGRMFSALYGSPVVLLRPFMTYGPGQHPSKLIPSVALSLLKGRSPKLSSGRTRMDWVFVSDIIDAFMLAAAAPGIEGTSIDLGTGTLVSVRAVAEQIAEAVDSKTPIAFGAMIDRPQENEFSADTALAAETLGWTATTSLERGLRQTVDWYREAELVHS